LLKKKIFLSLLTILPGILAFSQATLLKFEPVSFSKVNITDNFWKPKMTLVVTKTLNACIYQTETATPRIKNFINVAKNDGQKHQGIFFDDSDVYKAMEAMAYSLKNNPNPVLEKKADEWIDIIASAQQPDGYLNTYFTLEKGQKRWSDMDKHEDYCAGHMIEAAIAYFNTTGKRKFLDVAIRFADHIDSTFRLQNRHWISGHEEIEIALVKLYKNTGNKKYLDLADWYAAATVVCVPSYNESFGLVAIEAQACGTPVVAARVGGLATAVSDGVSGILVDGHDPADYADAFATILGDPALRESMSQKAVRHAECFGWDITAERTLEVYREAIEAHRKAES